MKATEQLDVPPAGEPAVALVIGYDKRAGRGRRRARSDTLMLLRADPTRSRSRCSRSHATCSSTIYCPGSGAVRDRINSAYAHCGSKGTLETVKS